MYRHFLKIKFIIYYIISQLNLYQFYLNFYIIWQNLNFFIASVRIGLSIKSINRFWVDEIFDFCKWGRVWKLKFGVVLGWGVIGGPSVANGRLVSPLVTWLTESFQLKRETKQKINSPQKWLKRPKRKNPHLLTSLL